MFKFIITVLFFVFLYIIILFTLFVHIFWGFILFVYFIFVGYRLRLVIIVVVWSTWLVFRIVHNVCESHMGINIFLKQYHNQKSVSTKTNLVDTENTNFWFWFDTVFILFDTVFRFVWYWIQKTKIPFFNHEIRYPNQKKRYQTLQKYRLIPYGTQISTNGIGGM